MRRICIFGATGQLGRRLCQDLAGLGEISAPSRAQLDLTDPAAVRQWFNDRQFDIIVNAAAMTQVDVAETSVELTHQLNCDFVQQLAEYAAQHNCWLVHFSTDYVFDGAGDTPWRETDPCRPLQRYGLSKRAGELAIIAAGCKHVIFRTSWLYDIQGQNFLLTMLRLAQQPSAPLHVVSDQIGAPTFAPVLSATVAQLLNQLLSLPAIEANSRSGLYHLCAQGHCSWYDFAAAIFTTAKAKGLLDELPQLQAISSAELTRPALRPNNSRLDTSKVQATFNLRLTDWQQQLQQCLELLKKSAKTGK
jgi:dTDP-4-dehydrorhamnose reductase